MTTTVTALLGVREEVENRILALTPHRIIKQRATFMLHKNDKKPITEMMGRSRLFEIGDFDRGPRWHIGIAERGVIYTAPITIVYARGPEWAAAALDDIDQIDDDLLLNPTIASGVAIRTLLRNTIPLVSKTPHPSEPWDYYTVVLEANLSVTDSD